MSGLSILINTYGSLGDLNPYLAIAEELVSRGHQVTMVTCRSHKETILKKGIAYFPSRPDFEWNNAKVISMAMSPVNGTESVIRKLIIPFVTESYDDLLAAAREVKPDILLNHSICFEGPLVAEVLGIRWISCNLSPNTFWSIHDPSVIPQFPLTFTSKFPGFGFAFNRSLMIGARAYTDRWFGQLYRLRKVLGLGRGGHPLFEGQFSPYKVLALFSGSFAGMQPDWPKQARITGFPFLAGSGELDRDLADFIQKERPPVAIALGSTVSTIAVRLTETICKILKKLGKRTLVIGPTIYGKSGQRDETIFFANAVRHRQVFKYCSLIIHHGGIGTTAEAMRAGVPMLVIPFAVDQPDNAIRAQKLGVGEVVFPGWFQRMPLEKKIVQLLSDNRYRINAQALSEIIRSENGVTSACDEIQSINMPQPV